MDSYARVFGRQLAALRHAKHLTQPAAAQALCFAVSTVRAYERGAVVPPFERLHALCSFYGVPPLMPILRTHRSLVGGDPPALDPAEGGLIERALLTWHVARLDTRRIRQPGQEIDAKAIGRALADMRNAHRLELRVLADRMANTTARLSQVEIGRHRLTLHELSMIGDVYGDGLLRLLVRLAARAQLNPALWTDRDVCAVQEALLAWEAAIAVSNASPPRKAVTARMSPARAAAFWSRLGDAVLAMRVAGADTQSPPHVPDVPRRAVARIEAATRRARPFRLDAICWAYGVSVLALLAHAADPDSSDLRPDIGGSDAPGIASALVTWDLAAPRTASRYRIGRRLQELRTANEATIETLARQLVLSEADLLAREEGERRTSLKHLFALADLYRVPALALLLHVTSEVDPPPARLGVGGPDADEIVSAMLAWEAANAKRTRAGLLGTSEVVHAVT